jgi:hypothetical protein
VTKVTRLLALRASQLMDSINLLNALFSRLKIAFKAFDQVIYGYVIILHQTHIFIEIPKDRFDFFDPH